jgi:thiamine biosynthesis protein ThiS
MKLHINGDERAFPDTPASLTLAALVEVLGMKPDRVAVELNRDIVPRDRWGETALNEGDRLEIVQFVGGGSTSPLARSHQELS